MKESKIQNLHSKNIILNFSEEDIKDFEQNLKKYFELILAWLEVNKDDT